jgi:anaerobic ribonucleoside-triphosphate reductase activating protein
MAFLRIAKTLQGSRANGPGLRDVYWTAGCSIRCPGCCNSDLFEKEIGELVEVADLIEKLKYRIGIIEGITITGGEPGDQALPVAEFCKGVKELGFSVVIFTGHTLGECRSSPMMDEMLSPCDIVIAGPFDVGRGEGSKKLIASANQSVFFLSNRYCLGDLADIPDYEIIFDGREITITGTHISAAF